MVDFNMVSRLHEFKGSLFKPIRAIYLNQFLRDNELHEVKQGGHKYTWISVDGMKMSKLDHFLSNRAFQEDWPDLVMIVKNRVFVYHCLILLKITTMDFRPAPFKCFDKWLKIDGFKELVKTKWNKTKIKGQRTTSSSRN